MVPKIAADGILVCGDAAGFCVNLGYSVRGMDYAVESGRLAAEAVIEAREKGSFDEAALSCYRSKLEQSFVLQDLATFKKFPDFLETTPRMFKEYPQLASDTMKELFIVDGQPKTPLRRSLKDIIKRYGIWQTIKDLRKGMEAM